MKLVVGDCGDWLRIENYAMVLPFAKKFVNI